MSKIIDDKHEHIEDDIAKIQTRPGMYIGYLGQEGSLHLSKEIINNAIDECINKNSPGNLIDIFLDETENTLTVSDNGRGIPDNFMEILCTKLQSGSKFVRAHGSTAGENGAGMTACNALSDRFEIISYRGEGKFKIAFSKGQITEPLNSKKLKSYKTGTTVIMKPSNFYMGKDCDIPAFELIAWIEKIVYLLSPHIKINLYVKKRGKDSVIDKKYVNKNGLKDFIKTIDNKLIVDPIHFKDSMELTEESRGEVYDRFIETEIAFSYSGEDTEFKSVSFCNFVETVDGGVHVEAVKQAILQYFIKQTRDSLSEREAKKLDIIPSDAQQGLVLTVYLSTDMDPRFNSQIKAKVTNSLFSRPLRELTYRSLKDYFLTNSKELKKIIDKIKLNAKARIESTKVKNSVIKDRLKSFDEHMMSNFVPANNRGKNDYRELFIIEGDSALGTARSGRFDNNTQALYAIRGVPKNAYKAKLSEVLANPAMFTLVQILGCNIGDKFNMDDLKYQKIIIMTDSDSDGYNIASMLCAFFIMHMPEIVQAGKLYKASAPLYKIKNKEKPFILSKREYIEIFENNVSDNLIIRDIETNEPMSRKEMKEFLSDNRDYLEDIVRIANQFPIDPLILEYLVIHSRDDDFHEKFTKKFPELKIETVDGREILSGVFDGKYQILVMDNIYRKRIPLLMKYIFHTNKGNVYFKVEEYKNNKKDIIDNGILSLFELMKISQRFRPVIVNRFKGLGELDDYELCNTTLSPENRILLQLTTEVLEKDLEKFNILHGKNASDRKRLMEDFEIRREDLDN